MQQPESPSMSENYDKPMLGGCCVCLDERGWAENPLVYCDGQMCTVAVHQACYGIVKVPDGPWFCRKCESQERAAKVKCDLCPHRDGALKRTDAGGWAHVVCALYIPEVEFGNVTTMEPIVLNKVPTDRFHKTCYICEEESRSSKATSGACMSCNRQGCKQAFHVTCAQMSGITCEEASAGNTTKYCGYCKTHYAKMRKQTPHRSLSCAQVYRCSTYSSDEVGSPEKKLPPSLSSASVDGRLAEFRPLTVASTKYLPSKDTSVKAMVDDESKELTTDDEQGETSNPSSENILPKTTTTAENNVTNESYQSLLKYNENMNGALTLCTLAEAASALSQQSDDSVTKGLTEPHMSAFSPPKKPTNVKEEKPTKSKDKPETSKHKLSEGKEKKKSKEGKRAKTSDKVVKPKKQKTKQIKAENDDTSIQQIGIANQPRHSVVSLTAMGSDQMEPSDYHSIGDNNKLYIPDFTHDGLTILSHIADEQRSDSSMFFKEFGLTSDVTGLMEILQSVRNENKNLQSSIETMKRRKEQLLSIRTRLSLPLTTASDANYQSPPQAQNIAVMQHSPQHYPPQHPTTPRSNPMPSPRGGITQQQVPPRSTPQPQMPPKSSPMSHTTSRSTQQKPAARNTPVHPVTPRSTPNHQSAPRSTPNHQSAPRSTPNHQSAPRSTPNHQSAPRSTPNHQSAPRSTPNHQSAPRSTPIQQISPLISINHQHPVVQLSPYQQVLSQDISQVSPAAMYLPTPNQPHSTTRS